MTLSVSSRNLVTLVSHLIPEGAKLGLLEVEEYKGGIRFRALPHNPSNEKANLTAESAARLQQLTTFDLKELDEAIQAQIDKLGASGKLKYITAQNEVEIWDLKLMLTAVKNQPANTSSPEQKWINKFQEDYQKDYQKMQQQPEQLQWVFAVIRLIEEMKNVRNAMTRYTAGMSHQEASTRFFELTKALSTCSHHLAYANKHSKIEVCDAQWSQEPLPDSYLKPSVDSTPAPEEKPSVVAPASEEKPTIVATQKPAQPAPRPSLWSRIKNEIKHNDALRWGLYMLAGAAVAMLTVATAGAAAGVGAAAAFAALCPSATAITPAVVAIGVIVAAQTGVFLTLFAAAAGALAGRFRSWLQERSPIQSQAAQSPEVENAVELRAIGAPHFHLKKRAARQVAPAPAAKVKADAPAPQSMDDKPAPAAASASPEKESGCGKFLCGLFNAYTAAHYAPSSITAAEYPGPQNRRR